MKKILSRILSAAVLACILLTAAPSAGGYTAEEPHFLDLSGLIDNAESRSYVQMMLDYYLRRDEAVRQTLEAGYCAVFLFEGCSDNMDDPVLSDLSYYRVSAVCVAVRLDREGEPYIVYFNENCSTLPDRPLDYGAWNLDTVGQVGPATVCDGTYELYSVRHGGVYEALHLRTAYESDKISAVYMTPEGYTTAQADKINVHTRTGNHIIQVGMWSAGCILVGSGEYAEFTELMEASYYTVYDSFDIDKRVGSITINRQKLKEEMYGLYEDNDAVDMLLAVSRQLLPEMYLRSCTVSESYPEPVYLRAARDLELMTLPCSNTTDARSQEILTISHGEKLEIVGSIRNPAGNLWYEVEWDGRRGYVFSGGTEELGWFAKLLDGIFR